MVANQPASPTIRQAAFGLIDVLEKAGSDPSDMIHEFSDCLNPLLALPDLGRYGVAREGNHFSNSVWLYYDVELSIVFGPVPKLFSVPVHNHGTWEILCLYRGAIKYNSYLRRDDQQADYYAKLEPAENLIMRAGDITMVPPPPNDVHGFTGLADDTYALSVIGGALAPIREYYDPAQDTYVTGDPRDWRKSRD